MKEIDFEVLKDIKYQMDRCTCLAIHYVSIITTDPSKEIDTPESREILRSLLCNLIMENDVLRVLDFITVPLKFVMGEESDKMIEKTKKIIESIDISFEDRLLYAIFR